ncbi:hypothetical protein CQA66_07660 [Helicobacter aurati]|uniref:Uncharacterized protein n=1 Tax=Helicobacter aurati TaxID=137778 RepID=A0A3D8J0G3_9HELI|nr:hypothetical protein [Helicobacter aurati]RDU70706.1 hypothetical protein CQA66_07660 [Helicobacter aurati]
MIYADIGCEFIPKNVPYLLQQLECLHNNDIVGFHSESTKEKYWTKADVFLHFGVLDNPKFTESPQIKGGVIFMKKSNKTLRIIDEWLQIFYNHFHLVTDSPSRTANYPEFQENRHDQSIFSLLMKIHNCVTLQDYMSTKASIESSAIRDSRDKQFLPHDWNLSYTWESYSPFVLYLSRILFAILGRISPTSKMRKKSRAYCSQIKWIEKYRSLSREN